MCNSILLLAGLALVSLPCLSYAHIGDDTLDVDNNLMPIPNEVRRSKPFSQPFVRIAPKPPATVKYEPGTSLVLECGINGNPTPFVMWLKNGVLVSDFEEDANELHSVTPFSPAVLTSKYIVNRPSNGDVFTCIAVSDLIEVSASTTIIVEDDSFEPSVAQILQSKPMITLNYKGTLQMIGSTVILPCRFYSPSKSQVFWLNSDHELVYGNNRIKVLPSGDLQISDLVWEDMGRWTCTVKNAYGKDVAVTFIYPYLKS